MKLLVLAQVPPPLHGQSLMTQTLVDGLPAQGLAVHHVNLGLSRDAADIGRWRWGKPFTVLAACARTIAVRFHSGCDTLYYIPAPGKRGALYRDWTVLLLCRPFFKRLVLHWHAGGLAEWLTSQGSTLERWLTNALLGRADLSIVLGENLRGAAAVFHPRQLVVVRNGISDPCPGFVRSSPANHWREAIFLGLGLRDKGLFDAAEAVLRSEVASDGRPWRLTAAGDFPDPATAREFTDLVARSEGRVRHLGFVTGATKDELLARADALIFPTYYSAETQGLVVAEALAHDLPMVVTDWRGVAEDLPARHVQRVSPRAPDEIAASLARIAAEAPPAGASRQHFLAHYTREIFLARLAAALRALDR